MNNNKQIDMKKVSQTMSWILRHGIIELGLKIDELGRIPLQILLEQKQIRQLGCDEEMVRKIVDTSDKKKIQIR